MGILIGGVIGTFVLADPTPVELSAKTHAQLAALGIHDFTGLVPSGVLSWRGLLTLPGLVLMVGGGFLVGFGAAYGGGCTSGHGISGLADLQLASLIAVIAMFAAGSLTSFFLLPLILR